MALAEKSVPTSKRTVHSFLPRTSTSSKLHFPKSFTSAPSIFFRWCEPFALCLQPPFVSVSIATEIVPSDRQYIAHTHTHRFFPCRRSWRGWCDSQTLYGSFFHSTHSTNKASTPVRLRIFLVRLSVSLRFVLVPLSFLFFPVVGRGGAGGATRLRRSMDRLDCTPVEGKGGGGRTVNQPQVNSHSVTQDMREERESKTNRRERTGGEREGKVEDPSMGVSSLSSRTRPRPRSKLRAMTTPDAWLRSWMTNP